MTEEVPAIYVECFRAFGFAAGGAVVDDEWVAVGGARFRPAASPFLAMGCRTVGSSVDVSASVESAFWYEHPGPLASRDTHRVAVTAVLSGRIGPVVAGAYGTFGWWAIGGGVEVRVPYDVHGSSVDFRLGVHRVWTPEVMSIVTWSPSPRRWSSK
jgi:hypothetical protein